MSCGEGVAGRSFATPAASPACKLCWDGFPKETLAWSPPTGFGRVYKRLSGCSTRGQVQISTFTPQTSTQQLSELWVKEECGSAAAWWSLSKAEGLLASQGYRKPKILSSGNAAC